MAKSLRQAIVVFAFMAPMVAVAQQADITTPSAEPQWTEADIDLLVPDTIKPSGEHGTVTLEGDITPAPRIANLVVAKSSGSTAIDNFARDRFGDSKVDQDLMARSPTRIRLTVKIYNTKGLDFGGTLTCAQAVLDADWYARAFPGKGIERQPLYRLIQGSSLIDGRLSFARDTVNYDRIWTDTVNVCRTVPTAIFLPTMVAVSKKKR